ncbi:tyrosine-type recombinase/integrase [Paludisphaera soli]|uniref:tyrosine-type recombinase/integrase n=1 Tax=Paludisphaera soli TaxID=2712865 RepID=UPI0013ECB345|nr:tyrosine-type recombinase/integrase [Paludisphaera soli]
MASLRKRGKTWYYRFTDADGVKREQKGCSDKRVTEELARAAESEAAKIREGLLDPRELAYRAHQALPFVEHAEAWAESLRARETTPRHVSLSMGRLRRLVAIARGADASEVEYPRAASAADRARRDERLAELLAPARLSDLDGERVQRALAELRGRGLSLQSLNHYRAVVRSFAIWCHQTGRVRDDVVRGVRTYNAQEDRRHDRRTLGVDDLHRLVRAAEEGPTVLGMTGPARALCYRLAVTSGLRYSELASIRRGSFDWDADPATLAVSPAYTKNGQPALVFIPADLAGDLLPFVETVAAEEAVFPLPPERGAEMLRADLERAGIPYVDASGRFFDFHSLRCQTATLLDAAGVTPRVAQRVMRHSTPGLTDRYTKPRAVDVERAALSLPSLKPSPEARSASTVALATGTGGFAHRGAEGGQEPTESDTENQAGEGPHISKLFAHHLPTGGDGSGRFLSDSVVMTDLDEHPTMKRFTPEKTGENARSRLAAAPVASDRGGARTHDQRINLPHRLSPTTVPWGRLDGLDYLFAVAGVPRLVSEAEAGDPPAPCLLMAQSPRFSNRHDRRRRPRCGARGSQGVPAYSGIHSSRFGFFPREAPIFAAPAAP